MHGVILDERPEQVNIEVLENGYKELTLYRNITEVEIEGQTKYKADCIKQLFPPMHKIDKKDFTEEKINFYFEQAEKEEKETERNELILQLDIIDKKTIRPLRAIDSGEYTEADTKKLKELEAQAEAIRAKIKALGA